jgi:DNA polymerase-3 subunit delta
MAASKATTLFPRPEEIFARLGKEPLSSLYLFYGDEPYFIGQAVAGVRKRLGPETAVHAFYAGEDALARVLEAWEGPSLFAAQSLVVLKGAERLKAAERERLAQEAELHDATQPLVVCAQGRVDLRQQFFALCAKKGFVAEFRPPFANQIPEWAQRFARERKVRLTEEAALLLADLIGPDLLALGAEVDKLVAFVAPRTEIDAEAVTACTGDVHKHSVFDLADALGQRDQRKALRLLREVMTDERGALQVLQALVGHFRRLWRVKELLENGTSEPQIEQVIGLRGARLRSLMNQSRLYTMSDLRQLFHHAAALDMTLKSSRTSPQALFDALVLDVCARPT